MKRYQLSALIVLLSISCLLVACVQTHESAQQEQITPIEKVVVQKDLLPKTLDKTHNTVFAIVLLDSADQYIVAGTGTLIHPQVILTAGHVSFGRTSKYYGTSNTKGYVTSDVNARRPQNRTLFDWEKDIVSHPSQSEWMKSFSDSTKESTSAEYYDIGLVFLNEAINTGFSQLPEPSILSMTKGNSQFTGVGYGLHVIADSTFNPEDQDGSRRYWEVQNFWLINESWIEAACDSVSNLQFVSAGDSGGAMFLGDSVVVGVWSNYGDPIDECKTSLAVRIDNTEVLSWIRSTVKSRLGIDI